MATVTPNFNWPVPTSTDLVKDGATAIEALGDSIDASLVDLKGGTTGQVLAKASNTDLDYTWTTPQVGDITGVTAGTGISGGGTSGTVTVTNSMATEIAAKGDLIAGTGSQTFDNLTVGSNFAWLKADSTSSTGLVWDNDDWTSFTPTITAASGSFTSVSATGFYRRIGKVCFVQTKINITTNGTAANAIYSTLPFAGVAGRPTTGLYREEAATGAAGQIQIENTTATWRRMDNTYPGANGWVLVGSFFYQVL